jgi:hypothetical protein
VTVTWPESVAPVELVPMIVYAVVTVGETTIDPDRATGVPFSFALTQLMVFQVSVELPPAEIVLGVALIPAAGGPPDPTVTVTVAVAVVPEELLAMRV